MTVASLAVDGVEPPGPHPPPSAADTGEMPNRLLACMFDVY